MPDPALLVDLPTRKGPFFEILHTTSRSQTGFMTIAPGEEAGAPEAHADADQVIYVVEGAAEIKVWEEGEARPPREAKGGAGLLVVVPAGTRHWVKSVGAAPLLFLTVYAPPEY